MGCGGGLAHLSVSSTLWAVLERGARGVCCVYVAFLTPAYSTRHGCTTGPPLTTVGRVTRCKGPRCVLLRRVSLLSLVAPNRKCVRVCGIGRTTLTFTHHRRIREYFALRSFRYAEYRASPRLCSLKGHEQLICGPRAERYYLWMQGKSVHKKVLGYECLGTPVFYVLRAWN